MKIILGRRFERKLSVNSGQKKGKETTTPFHSQLIAHQGACHKPLFVPQNRRPKPESAEMRGREVRVLLSTYGSRGDVELSVGLAVRLRAFGAQVRVCAPTAVASTIRSDGATVAAKLLLDRGW